MMHLYLLRHGIAVPHGTPEVPDDERPLTPKGERRMRQIGRGLRDLGVKVDRIVSSPLPRALRSAEVAAEALRCTELLETSDALRAGRDAASIREWLRSREEPRLMIVGHNPELSDLIGLLVNGNPGQPVGELRKGGVAALAPRGDDGMTLDWMARPRLFRRLAR